MGVSQRFRQSDGAGRPLSVVLRDVLSKVVRDAYVSGSVTRRFSFGVVSGLARDLISELDLAFSYAGLRVVSRGLKGVSEGRVTASYTVYDARRGSCFDVSLTFFWDGAYEYSLQSASCEPSECA